MDDDQLRDVADEQIRRMEELLELCRDLIARVRLNREPRPCISSAPFGGLSVDLNSSLRTTVDDEHPSDVC